jgi:hypothetical protein
MNADEQRSLLTARPGAQSDGILLDGAVRSRLGPGFYSFVDRLKTTHQPLSTLVPEIFQMYQSFAF